jgi:hypothetical protein
MFERRLTLLRTQKKRVYEILRETSLEPAEFSWSNERIVDKLVVSKLKHRDGQHYFQFSSCEINAWCIACPGLYRTMDYRYPKSWEEQEDIFRQWAASLRSELDTEDPWQELAKYRLALDGELSAEAVNEPIPAVEADQIAQLLVQLGDEVIREFSLNAEQSLALRAKLDYLAQASRRQRSRDWVYMVLGACTTTAMALSLTEQQAATWWEIVSGELSAFVQLQPTGASAAR